MFIMLKIMVSVVPEILLYLFRWCPTGLLLFSFDRHVNRTNTYCDVGSVYRVILGIIDY